MEGKGRGGGGGGDKSLLLTVRGISIYLPLVSEFTLCVHRAVQTSCASQQLAM